MSKRPADESAGQSGGPKKSAIAYLPHTIGSVSNSTEMDISVLKFQNKKLAERIEQRKRTETELKARIDQLESRQTKDDAVLNAVNRYWNRFNEDIRVLLQRFDAETADEQENESEVTTSFLAQLSTWDKNELDENLANRVIVSRRAVGKIIQAFDRLMQRNDKISQMFDNPSEPIEIEESLRDLTTQLIKENRNLNEQNMKLHAKNEETMLKEATLLESLAARETAEAELKHKIDGLEYELEKIRCRNDKLENHLAESIEKIKSIQVHGIDKNSGGKTKMMSVASNNFEELKKDLEDYKELANNRLHEMDKLHEEKAQALKEVEKLKMDLKRLPESVIVETTEYKILQSQFSVLYNESMNINTQLEELRCQLVSSKAEHQRQIEYLESNELNDQRRLREELLQKQYIIDETRKEFDKLRSKYELNVTANQQTAKITREMRELITSLQNRNNQFQRYKQKYREVSSDNARLRKELEDVRMKLNAANIKHEEEKKLKIEGAVKKEEPSDEKSFKNEESSMNARSSEPNEDETEDDKNSVTATGEKITGETVVKKEEGAASANANSAHIIEKLERENRDLKTQLKKALSDLKDTKLVVDQYKGVSKDTRDKVQWMAAEKRVRAELEEMKIQMKKLQETKRDDRKKMVDEDLIRKYKQLEEKNIELHKQLASRSANDGPWSNKQFIGSNEEEALLNEIDVTGQAYEEMQEQNVRLLQELTSKDNANLELLSDRNKASQKESKLTEKIEALELQVQSNEEQIKAMVTILRKFEEKEKIYQSTVMNLEKALDMKHKALEGFRRKAVESTQTAAELKMHLDKYVSSMTEAEQSLLEKTNRLEQESYKNKRMQENLDMTKRTAERFKNYEMSDATVDEVVLRENREYREQLLCDSCKVKQKDAVISKCFHVFCYECLRSRYDSRQRKCPKCNCAFGANDFHRLYLT